MYIGSVLHVQDLGKALAVRSLGPDFVYVVNGDTDALGGLGNNMCRVKVGKQKHESKGLGGTNDMIE